MKCSTWTFTSASFPRVHNFTLPSAVEVPYSPRWKLPAVNVRAGGKLLASTFDLVAKPTPMYIELHLNCASAQTRRMPCKISSNLRNYSVALAT